MSSATERDGLVKSIVDLTNAEIFEAIVMDNRVAGCIASHTEIYKRVPEGEDLMVFEDDCEIFDASFPQVVAENKHKYDLMYIGVNMNTTSGSKITGSYGTHAMWISPKAIKIFLKHKHRNVPFDHIWNDIEKEYKLSVWRPSNIHQYVKQKSGLVSYITGGIRK
jgi:hypothetical protein